MKPILWSFAVGALAGALLAPGARAQEGGPPPAGPGAPANLRPEVPTLSPPETPAPPAPPRAPEEAPGARTPGELPPEQPAAPAPAPGPVEDEGVPPAPAGVVRQQIPAFAVEAAEEDRALMDRANRSLKLRRWEQAAQDFEKLKNKYGTTEYELNYALCLYELGRLDQARAIYEKVLNDDPDNIEALISIARIRARSAAAERDPANQGKLLDAARDALKRAAANGANALRAIKSYPELDRAFETDVTLKIDLIRAPQRLLAAVPRDPFRNLLPKIPGPGARPGETLVEVPGATRLTLQQQREIVDRLRARLGDLKRLVAEKPPNYEAIARTWLEIEELAAQQEKVKSTDLEHELKLLIQMKDADKVLVQQLLLKALYTQGERILEQMEAAFHQEQYTKVAEGWELLQNHARRMKATDPQFGKAAADLESRGQSLFAKSQILAETEKIQFQITGIVVGASVAQAIINNRILTEEDVVYDVRGNPIADLRVATIKKKRVRFRYKGLEFERPLVAASR